MPMETRSSSALFKRAEQLRRWQESETNQECPELLKEKPRRIKFSDGCVFLAACAAGDKDEVERLLVQGADINTANVDGLTALHQACIDDNLDMVEFLVEHECDLNRGDNEGWTPLHATSSCGFVSIARFLIESGANVAAVNNDGDLPIDIGESGQIEELLQLEINRLGIDCDAVRLQEENLMLEDANNWLSSGCVSENLHPKTGASALHVAAAKGYIKVISLLIQTGVDLNAQDNDGWTPLHAASHWGQKEACQILTENLANMDIKNFSGQTCFDICDPDLLKLLEELKNKQAFMQRERPEIQAILRAPCKAPPPLKRRTSVTRMSGADKSSQGMKDTILERAQIEANLRLEEEEEDDRVMERRPAAVLEENAVVEARDLNNAVLNEISVIQRLQEASPQETPKQPAPEPAVPAVLQKQPSVEEKAPWRKVSSEKEPSPTKGVSEEQAPLSRVTPIPEKPVEEVKVNKEKPVIAKLKTEREDSEDVLTDESSTPTDESLNGLAKRMFLPPTRDDESEAQRKAHAKRVRETRRSTQGVTLEDLKSAEQQLLRKQQEEDERRERESDLAKPKTPIATSSTTTPKGAVTTTVTTTTVPTASTTSTVITTSTAPPVSTTPSATTHVAPKGNVTIPTVAPSSTKTTQPAAVASPEKRISWRTRSEEILKPKEEAKEPKDEPVVLRRFQETNHVPITNSQTNTVTNHAAPSVPATISTPTRIRQRPVSAPVESTTVPSTVAPLRTRIKTEPQPQLDNVGENEDLDKDADNKNGSQASLQRRRRPKRRSTGVVYIDGEDNPEIKSDSIENTQSKEKEEEKVPERQRIRYGSSSSLQDGRASDRSRTASLNSSTSSLNEEVDRDYKKLYLDMKDENERLKKKLCKVENELDTSKQDLQRVQRNMRNSLNDGDKRERRALERKLSELEEEVKNLAKVKAENEKLKAENRALTRVVSNFSK